MRLLYDAPLFGFVAVELRRNAGFRSDSSP